MSAIPTHVLRSRGRVSVSVLIRRMSTAKTAEPFEMWFAAGRVPKGHEKSWKVMEFWKTIFQAWKAMETAKVIETDGKF